MDPWSLVISTYWLEYHLLKGTRNNHWSWSLTHPFYPHLLAEAVEVDSNSPTTQGLDDTDKGKKHPIPGVKGQGRVYP